MCKVNDEGITFKDGLFVSYKDIDMLNLSEAQIKDLYSTPLSLAFGIQIRKRLHEQGNFFQNMTNKIDEMNKKLDNAINESNWHSANCPIDSPKMKTIIENHIEKSEKIHNFLLIEWKKIFKETIITWGNVAKAITAILVLFSLLYMIMETIKK